MILIALSYATLLIITLFFLFKKKLYFTLNFIILSSIPSLALLVNIDSEFINYEMYYIFSTFILISLIIISLLLPNLSYSRNIIGCSSSSKSLRYLAIVLIGLFIFAGLKAFKGNDSYMALHRGEVFYSTWLYILHKLSYLFVVYHLFFRRLRTHDLIYALVIIASPSLFLFILGFRSPLLINTVFIFTLLIHINLRFFLWKKFPYRKVLILLILFLLLFVLVSVKRHDEAFSSNLLHIFVMQSVVGSQAGKEFINESFALNNFSNFSVSCLIFNPSKFSNFIPRSIYLQLLELFNINHSNCFSFTSYLNEKYKPEVDGGGLAGSFIADINYEFGPFYIYTFLILLVLHWLFLDYAVKQFSLRVIALIALIYINNVWSFLYWRNGIDSIILIDFLILFSLFLMLFSYRIGLKVDSC